MLSDSESFILLEGRLVLFESSPVNDEDYCFGKSNSDLDKSLELGMVAVEDSDAGSVKPSCCESSSLEQATIKTRINVVKAVKTNDFLIS